jgi:predicted transcriptional regulator
MKRVVNFRLSEQAVHVLLELEKKMHYSKTAIVENALQMYAKKELGKQAAILKFAGSLNEQDADIMLDEIYENKHNKDIQVEL